MNILKIKKHDNHESFNSTFKMITFSFVRLFISLPSTVIQFQIGVHIGINRCGDRLRVSERGATVLARRELHGVHHRVWNQELHTC